MPRNGFRYSIRSQFFITFYDDIKRDPHRVASALYAWLGLPPYEYRDASKVRYQGVVRGVIDGVLTIDPLSQSRFNKKIVAGQATTDQACSIKISERDLTRLYAIFANDIEWVRRTFNRADLDWAPKSLEAYVNS